MKPVAGQGESVLPALPVDLAEERDRLSGVIERLRALHAPDEASLEDLIRDLAKAADALDAFCSQDWSTRLEDPHSFAAALTREWGRSQRTGRPLALVVIGIDGLDAAGSGALDSSAREVAVARALRGCLHRAADRLARYPNGRFAALLPEVTREGAVSVAERMRRAVRDLQLDSDDLGQRGRVTLSAGISTGPWPDHFGAPSVISAADEALALAMELGGDRVVEGA